MRSKILPALLLCAAGLANARGWTVSPTDTLGANFRDLQAAIDSAAPGDTLWLEHGSWGSVSLSKPLVVIGRQATKEQQSYLTAGLQPSANGTVFLGVNLILELFSGCASSIEVGYSTVMSHQCLEGSYIHHSRVKHGLSPIRKTHFRNSFMESGAFVALSSQNIFDHVTVLDGGIGGQENVVANSVMSRTLPEKPSAVFHGEATETHYRHTFLWNVDSVEIANSAVGCRFRDSVLASSGPFLPGYRVKPAYAAMSDDGTEPGMFGGKAPLRLVGNEADLIPLMPLPWLRTIALERLRVKPSDSVKVFLEAQSGR